MDFSKYDERPWFEELKRNVSEYYDKNNAVESAKFGYDRDIKIPQWILGIGISLIIFSKAIIDSLASFWKEIALLIYLTTVIVLVIGIWKIIVLAQRHRIGLMYVYREKDKQDKERNDADNPTKNFAKRSLDNKLVKRRISRNGS